MEANRSRQRWTWAEYARLPTSGSTRYEVIEGRVEVTPSPTARHQAIVTELVAALHGFVSGHGLGRVYAGPLDVLLAEGDYVQPDVLFLRGDRLHLLSERGVEGPPDLVVEVLSPATANRDRGVKLERYRHYGVREYWVVDPGARAIDLWQLGEGALEPRVMTEVLHWTPVEGGPTLELQVPEVLGEE